MAEISVDNVSLDAMKTHTGETGTTDGLEAVVQSATIEKWSFYRPRPNIANASTKLVEIQAKTTDLKLGDFRKYDDASIEPALNETSRTYTYVGAAAVSVSVKPQGEDLNVKELSGSDPYWRTEYYKTSGDRAAGTNLFASDTTAMATVAVTPPVGHSMQETIRPASGFQLITKALTTTTFTKPTQLIYTTTFITNSGDTEDIAKFTTGMYGTWTCTQQQIPKISESGPNFSIGGYTTSFMVVTVGSSDCAGVDMDSGNSNVIVFTNNASFYIHLVGRSGGTWYRLGATSISLKIVVDGVDYTMNTSSLSSSGNTQEVTNDFWGTAKNWAYDDIGEVTIVSVSGVSQGSACTP